MDAIDEFIGRERGKQHLPGVSLALVKNGNVVKASGYGQSNIELDAPADSRTVYQIGSLTKQFTAAAILLLKEEQKLQLDDPVHEHIEGIPPAWEGITLRHLLTHTSGLKNVTELPEFDYHNEYTEKELLDLLVPLPLDFKPGQQWSYTNTGYVLLGWIIQKRSGQSYGDYLSERIFKPLEMADTRTIDPKEIVPRRGFGYCWEGRIRNGDPSRPQAIAGAGGLLSTVLDLAKWDAALHAESPLNQALKEEMWTPALLSNGALATTRMSAGEHYGMGWFLGEYRGRKMVSHTGETDAGFNSEILRFYEERLTLILLCNLEPMEQDQLTKGIADLCFK
jgi:CubicO group peptidase (beta-lactamase class C family)